MLVNEEGRKLITDAIAAAEKRSGVEIVFCEASRSDDYERWLALPMFLATLASALVLHGALPTLATVWLLLLQLPLAALWWGLLHVPVVGRWVIPDVIEIEAVRRRAVTLFAEHALFETPCRIGVLVLLSAFERRVHILADRGLNALISSEAWAADVEIIRQHIRVGTAATGVCKVIDRIAASVPCDGVNVPQNFLPDSL